MTPAAASNPPVADAIAPRQRITSVDALRGLVMFTMIFVNDLSGASREVVPDWMVHFSERHPEGASGMTFVDLVFPAFLFIMGMAIPFALGARLNRDRATVKPLGHVLTRTLALLFLGILMVNESPSTKFLGWPATWWTALLYVCAIVAWGEMSSPRRRWISWLWRGPGLVALVWLAFAWRGKRGLHIITLQPFSLHHDWYGILGLIGWAYLVGSLAGLLFRGRRTALLGVMVLLFCLYPADKTGLFDRFWLSRHVDIGESLGSLAAITVAGVLLGTMLRDETLTVAARVRFTLWFIVGTAAAALLTGGLYGINKDASTPAWCLWACACTAALWLGFYLVADVWRWPFVSRPFAVVGQNVLLAYLISEGLESWLSLAHLGDWYDRLAEPSLACATTRAAGCAAVILLLTAGLNRLGFRLKF